MQPYILILLGSALLCTNLSLAAPPTAYKWTDADGLTHYGETPPEHLDAVAIPLTPAPEQTSRPDPGYYSVLQQAERLEAARLAREQARAEAQAAQRQAQREAAQTEAAIAAAEFYRRQEEPPAVVYRPLRPHARQWKNHERRHHDERLRQHSGRDPAFDPPRQWLETHPRLLRKELRAQRDYNRRREQ